MKLFLIICAVIIPNVLSESIKTVREVLILTDDNYESAISSNEYLMLDFYAPWCGPCRKLSPEYFKAAEILHDTQPEIKLAKVNVDEEENIAEKYDVRSLPTLKFFRKGSIIEYEGGRQAEQIVKWLIKKSGAPAKQLSSVEEAHSFIEANKVAVIGFFKNPESDGAKTYVNVADDLSDILSFAIVSDDAVFSEYEAKEGTIIIFKQFDDPKTVFNGDLSEESIKDFITKNSKAILQEFHLDRESINTVFKSSIKNCLFLLVSDLNEDFKPHENEIKEVAKEFKDQVTFMLVDIDDEEMAPFLDKMRGPGGRIPEVILTHVTSEDSYQLDTYKYEKKGYAADNIRQFVQDYLDGKLKPYEPTEEGSSNEKTDEPEYTTEETKEGTSEEVKEDTSEGVKEESEDSSSESSEEEGNGSKGDESKESQEESLTEAPKKEKKAKRSHRSHIKRAIDNSDVIKKMYKTVHFSL